MIYHRTAEQVAVLLLTRPALTDRGRAVQEHVLFRVECAMWIEAALSAGKEGVR